MKVFLSLLLVCAVLGELTPERKDNLRKLTQVIKEMKELAQNLKDKDLCNALCVTADGILEQIMLINQKCQIF